MKKFAILLIPLTIIGCSEPNNNAQQPTTSSSTPSPQTLPPTTPNTNSDPELTKMQKALMGDIPYTTNDKGIVKVAKVDDMLKAFNDYKDYKINSEQPANFEIISETVATDSQKNLDYTQRKALIYGIFKTFIYTDNDKVTVTASLKDIKTNKAIGKPITITTTKDQALQALKAHTKAQSFDDLVQLTDDPYRVKGILPSVLYDDLAKDDIQQAIINDLQKH